MCLQVGFLVLIDDPIFKRVPILIYQCGTAAAQLRLIIDSTRWARLP